jgi:murein DD-endopeptidase MepM/ murein hydrolase activator NlpD
MRRQFRIERNAKALKLGALALSLVILVVAGAASFTNDSSHSYVVQPGDSLWAISQANGLTVNQLAAANGMNPNEILLIGRTLYIPSATNTSSTASGASQGSSDPWTFCSTFSAPAGPVGVLPRLLADSPSRLALQPLYVHWADYYGLSLPLLEAIGWQESGWQQDVVSSTGAIGAGQIMPATAKFITSNLIGAPLNIHSVSDNIRMSAAFLAYLADAEGNNRCRTIAAYYEGPLNLAQYGVFPDTESYVASVEALIPEFE